jgi:hypothetical protein
MKIPGKRAATEKFSNSKQAWASSAKPEKGFVAI